MIPACKSIHYALQNDLGIINYVGLTLGKVYCGVVGGILCHEFAVLGPSVNLSARLLSMQNHPGFLINDDVRREALKWGNFKSFPPMKAKGYDYLVPVYQPLTAKESRWGNANPQFVRRKDKIKQVCRFAQEMAEVKGESRMFIVWGESGSGKTDFLVQMVSSMRKLLVTKRKQAIFYRNISNEGDLLIPFRYIILAEVCWFLIKCVLHHFPPLRLYSLNSLFRSIFRDMLEENNGRDNTSITGTISSKRDAEWDNLSICTMSTTNTLKAASAERLKEICDELGALRGFMKIVGYHL